MATRTDWRALGFARDPVPALSPKSGIVMYRCFGHTTSEFGEEGKGVYFSRQKPGSVLEAELLFSIAEWGNAIHFVSEFRLKPGFIYYEGEVFHAKGDLSLKACQIYVPPPVQIKVELLKSKETMRHDVTVLHLNDFSISNKNRPKEGQERGRA